MNSTEQGNANSSDYFMNNEYIVTEHNEEYAICCFMHSTSRRPLML